MSARTVVALAALLMACSTAQSDSTSTDDAVRAELDARRSEVERLAGVRDADAFLAVWTSDVYVREPGLSVDGEQFRAFVRDFLANGGILSLDIRPEKVHIHGDAAYEFGEYDERVVAGTDTMSIANHYAMRWTRGADGTWMIDHLTTGARDAP